MSEWQEADKRLAGQARLRSIADELMDTPLWTVLPSEIRKVLESAAADGWQLHGKGASIAFRLDKEDDELALPLYLFWQIGKTPTGRVSFRAGSAGTPIMAPMSIADAIAYMADPTLIWPDEEGNDSERADGEEAAKPESSESSASPA